MDVTDPRLKLAVIHELKASGVNVGHLCRRDAKLARTRSKKPKNSEKSKKSKKSTPSEATGGVFGVPLVELIANDGGKEVDGLVVPRILVEIGNTIQANITTEGLFRVNGSSVRMKQIQENIDKGHSVSGTVHDQTGLLKLYLRQLPEPLLTFQLYEAFICAYKLSGLEARKSAVIMLCLLLPLEHLHTLRFLLLLFRDIAHHSSTQMTSNTLASIISPNVIKPLESSSITSARELANHASCVGLTALLIENADQIGTVPVEVLDAAQQLDSEASQVEYLKIVSGRQRRHFCLFRRRRELTRATGAVSVQTLNLLKRSEREIQETRETGTANSQPSNSAIQYCRVLSLANGTSGLDSLSASITSLFSSDTNHCLYTCEQTNHECALAPPRRFFWERFLAMSFVQLQSSSCI
eukprot:gene2632-5534_t